MREIYAVHMADMGSSYLDSMSNVRVLVLLAKSIAEGFTGRNRSNDYCDWAHGFVLDLFRSLEQKVGNRVVCVLFFDRRVQDFWDRHDVKRTGITRQREIVVTTPTLSNFSSSKFFCHPT
jgi:hypothetical protein